MKIVHLVEHHSENMGYSDVCLSSSLSHLSNEVYVISSYGNAYFNHKDYDKIFSKFHKNKNIKTEYSYVNNYNLYRLKSIKTPFGIYLVGLFKLLKKIKPDIVQVGEVTSFLTFQATIYNFFINFILTIECHIHSSVYAPAKTCKNLYGNRKLMSLVKHRIKKNNQIIYKYFIAKIINLKIKSCFSISKDSYKIANDYLGIDIKKNKILTLGTDIELFYPSEKKDFNFKEDIGFNKNDIVCIYTGRFDKSKKPHLLSQALIKLKDRGFCNLKGLFIGAGTAEYTNLLKNPCTVVLPFVDYKDLPKYYRIADIAVWPNQESTSQLDALASGLPLILNHKTGTPERVEECGYLFKDDSEDDLADKIQILIDEEIRSKLSKKAVIKAHKNYSWKEIAAEYIRDYKKLIKDKYKTKK